MAEHGIAVELRGPDGRAQAISPRARAERLRARAVARWAATRTDLDRAAVAFDYARGAAAAAARGGVDPSAEVDRLIRALWAAGESLTRQLAETEDRHV